VLRNQPAGVGVYIAYMSLGLLQLFWWTRVEAGAVSSSGVNKAGRNAVVTSLLVCCGFIVCWTLNQTFLFLDITAGDGNLWKTSGRV